MEEEIEKLILIYKNKIEELQDEKYELSNKAPFMTHTISGLKSKIDTYWEVIIDLNKLIN